jgi:Bacterial membrane protein N terminal
MPWTNQGGGGPWGSGGKGPWGSGPQSSGPTPPDFEESLRRGQDKLRRVLPGGNLGRVGGSGVVPYLPLNELTRPPQPRAQPQAGGRQ